MSLVFVLLLVAAICAAAALLPTGARPILLAVGLLCAVLPLLVGAWPH